MQNRLRHVVAVPDEASSTEATQLSNVLHVMGQERLNRKQYAVDAMVEVLKTIADNEKDSIPVNISVIRGFVDSTTSYRIRMANKKTNI